MKHLVIALLALALAIAGAGWTWDDSAHAIAPPQNEDPSGGASGWQPCDTGGNAWAYVYMNDTVQGVYGFRWYQCYPAAGGGYYVWDYVHGAYFRNTVGVGTPWYSMPSQYTSAWLPA